MSADRADNFLQMIRRSRRGRLKVYLGYGPGVGKTYQMLEEGQRLRSERIDVVVGIVETHGRVETAKLVPGLEVVPRSQLEYRGITVEELDLPAVLARRPQVALVDELAHTNLPGSRNAKRYQDVEELLAAGIYVVTTLNVQHLESLYNTVEELVGVKVRERLPDSVLAGADEVVNIDLAPEDLRRRLRQGDVYPPDRAAAALENFFQPQNLQRLRELTLREVASQIDSRQRAVPGEDGGRAGSAPDAVLACIASRGGSADKLLRVASRLAGRLNRNWYALYVQTTSEMPTIIDARTQRHLSDTMALATQLGATVLKFKGEDVVATILQCAGEYRVGQIVIGRPMPLPFWRRFLGQRGVAERLIEQAEGLNVVVVDTITAADLEPARAPRRPSASAPPPPLTPPPRLHDLLSAESIVIHELPVRRDEVLAELAQRVQAAEPTIDGSALAASLADREALGSTFVGEGVALPHARVPGLARPHLALALTHAGLLSNAPPPDGDPAIAAVLLLVSPEGAHSTHLALLADAARLLRDQAARRELSVARTPREAAEVIRRHGE